MIKETRIRVAIGMMFAVLSILGSVQAHAAPAEVRYACEKGQRSLAIQRDQKTAHVRFGAQSYELRRKASSIGEKYTSGTAALIVDGATAIFVVEEPLQLGTCTEAVQVASVAH